MTLLNTLSVADRPPRTIGRLVAHEGRILEAEGIALPLGSGVRIEAAGGRTIQGEVAGFRGKRTAIVPFETAAPLALGGRVEADGRADVAQCGDGLIGRIVDAHGLPLDGLPLREGRTTIPLNGRRRNPLNTGRVTRPFATGVRAIDALLTLGEGQRVAIVAGSGVGKSVLMGQILAGADCDIIVAGLIGERGREVADFIATGLTPEARAKAVVVAVPADHAPLLRLRATLRATAIAEYFCGRGKRVLLLIDSLTRVAHAQREIGLALGEPPTMKGYPPSALGLIPGLVERAGVDVASGGSITALYTVLADGGDLDDPIVDAARAIADGHIVLSRQLAEQGVYPAIDIARSLSRVMPDVTEPGHVAAARRFRQLWSRYEENADLILMGAYQAGSDPLLDEAVARREEMLDFVRQAATGQVEPSLARALLIESFGA